MSQKFRCGLGSASDPDGEPLMLPRLRSWIRGPLRGRAEKEKEWKGKEGVKREKGKGTVGREMREALSCLAWSSEKS